MAKEVFKDGYRGICVLFLLYIIINLSTCGEEIDSSASTITPTIGATKPAPPPDWQYRWLKGIPCKPPCFEGITPGKTTAEEAVKLLQQNPMAAYVKTLPPAK